MEGTMFITLNQWRVLKCIFPCKIPYISVICLAVTNLNPKIKIVYIYGSYSMDKKVQRIIESR
jgi:hypothetical protein